MRARSIAFGTLAGLRYWPKLTSQIGPVSRNPLTRPDRVMTHPANHLAAEDIEDHVQIVVRPLLRAEQLGDVPAPDFVWARGQQLRRGVVRTTNLIAPFLNFVRGVQEAIHSAGRTEIGALIEQGRMDLRRRLVDQARVQQIQDPLTLERIERPRRRRARARDHGRSTRPIPRGPRQAQRVAVASASGKTGPPSRSSGGDPPLRAGSPPATDRCLVWILCINVLTPPRPQH